MKRRAGSTFDTAADAMLAPRFLRGLSRIDGLITTGNPMTGTEADDLMFDSEDDGVETTINANAGDDLVLGDTTGIFAILAFSNNGDSASAVSLDAIGGWTFAPDPLIGNATSIPHAAAYVEGTAGQEEWFSVNVGAGSSITIDVDYGASNIGGSTDTFVALFDPVGNPVASNDNADAGLGGLGSSSTLDSYLTYTATVAGTYFIRIYESSATSQFEGDEIFLINITIPSHAFETTLDVGGDTITGGAGFDELFGMYGDDSIDGGGENDLLHGGAGRDTLRGGTGNDTIYGALDGEFDSIDGGSFQDRLILPASSFGIRLNLQDGSTSVEDVVVVGIEEAIMGNGDDTVFASNSGGLIEGRGGNDILNGGDGVDILDGGAGNDVISLALDADTVSGGAGRDELFYNANGASFVWNMGTGVTNVAGQRAKGFENATVFGGADSITGTDAANLIITSDGEDTIRGVDGDDTLIGGTGADMLFGGLDDDTLIGDLGADALSGGQGIDTALYYAAVTVDLINPAGNSGEAAGDSYSSIENLLGSSGRDVLRGDSLANNIDGDVGKDKLVGRGGDDTLAGDFDRDTLTGGGGDDQFRLEGIDGWGLFYGPDTIVDFGVGGQDEIALDGDGFALPEGALNPQRFVLGTAAQDANDRLIYNDANGRLFFDSDGSGAQAQVLIATLTGAPALGAGDFIVI